MSIEAEIIVTLAEVEVDDQYRVQLRTLRRRTDLSPDEAVQLANELMQAAVEAETTRRADEAAWADDRAARSVVHGFDRDVPAVSS